MVIVLAVRGRKMFLKVMAFDEITSKIAKGERKHVSTQIYDCTTLNFFYEKQDGDTLTTFVTDQNTSKERRVCISHTMHHLYSVRVMNDKGETIEEPIDSV